jgi:hypothetical protein
MRKRQLSGLVFGRLRVIGPGPNSRLTGSRARVQWMCVCECGIEKIIGADPLISGRTQSCGCLKVERLTARSLTHGHSVGYHPSKEYRAWAKAKGRCLNPNDPKYAMYGGRGISMCSEWIASFETFLFDMGKAPGGYTLDRRNVNEGYSRENCRWATPRQQSRNKQASVWVIWRGVKMILKEVAEAEGISYKGLHALYRKRGIPLIEAVQSLSGH